MEEISQNHRLNHRQGEDLTHIAFKAIQLRLLLSWEVTEVVSPLIRQAKGVLPTSATGAAATVS